MAMIMTEEEKKNQTELNEINESAGTKAGKFLRNIAVPAAGESARKLAGLATIVPRSFAKVGGDIYNAATNQPQNADDFKVFPFKKTLPEKAASKIQDAVIGQDAISDITTPTTITQPLNALIPNQPKENTLADLAKPDMKFSNKIDQDNYNRLGLKGMLQSDNPNITKTLLTNKDGSYMVRESISGGPGAPATRTTPRDRAAIEASEAKTASSGFALNRLQALAQAQDDYIKADTPEELARTERVLRGYGQDPTKTKTPDTKVIKTVDAFGNPKEEIWASDSSVKYARAMEDQQQFSENHPAIKFLRKNIKNPLYKKKFQEKYGYLPSWAK